MAAATGRQLYKGYAALARYMASADGTMIFRRFGELHVRNLLYMQDELREIEEKLHEQDLIPAKEHGCRRRDDNASRRMLMQQLRSRLREYGPPHLLISGRTMCHGADGNSDEALLSAAAVNDFGSPKERPASVLKGFFDATRPLVEDEEFDVQASFQYLTFRRWEDAVPTWVTEKLRIGDWTSLTRSKELEKDFNDLEIDSAGLSLKFVSSARIRLLMRTLVAFFGCLFLLVPIIILFFLHTDAAKLAVIICSLVLFTTATAALTSAKNWEVVAASVAYAAVLVVFVGSNVGGS